MECISCHSPRVVKGALFGRHVGLIFSPDNIKFGAPALRSGTKLESFACLACGLVWNVTDPKKLEAFVRKHTNQKVDG